MSCKDLQTQNACPTAEHGGLLRCGSRTWKIEFPQTLTPRPLLYNLVLVASGAD